MTVIKSKLKSIDKKKSPKRIKRKSLVSQFISDEKFKLVSWGIFALVITLVSIGLVMVYSASSYYSLYVEVNPGTSKFITKQFIFAVVGIIAFLIISKIDYRIYKKLSFSIGIGTIILLILVMIIGTEVNGAKRWLSFGGITIQPSEIAKFAVVIILAKLLTRRSYFRQRNTFFIGIISPLIVAGIFAFLVVAQKSLSVAVIISATSFVMVFLMGANLKYMIGMFLAGIGGVFFLIISSPYRLARFTTFLNPFGDPSGDSYQLIHSLYAIGSGGLFGRGLGQSMQKALYMPEPHNDFIFAIIAEELGLIGCIVVILIFISLILLTIKVATSCGDPYGRLLAIGIVLVLGIQATINIAVVSGAMPVTGVPLPFISYGGTSLVVNLCAMGIVLNISRNQKNNV